MNPKTRSVILAVIGGMMAAAYLDGRGVVDLSYGFARGGFAEGALMALTGAIAGLAVLLVFRLLRKLANRDEK